MSVFISKIFTRAQPQPCIYCLTALHYIVNSRVQQAPQRPSSCLRSPKQLFSASSQKECRFGLERLLIGRVHALPCTQPWSWLQQLMGCHCAFKVSELLGLYLDEKVNLEVVKQHLHETGSTTNTLESLQISHVVGFLVNEKKTSL